MQQYHVEHLYDVYNEFADSYYEVVAENSDLILSESWVESLDPDLLTLSNQYAKNSFDENGDFIYPNENNGFDTESNICLEYDNIPLPDDGYGGEKDENELFGNVETTIRHPF